MVLDEQGIKRVVAILNQLSDQIFIFTDQGEPIKGPLKGKIDFPINLPLSEVFSYSGNIFYRSEDLPELVFVCNHSVEGGMNILILATNLAKNMLSNAQNIENIYDVYRRVLREDIYGQDLEMAAQEYQIPIEMERGILVFNTGRVEKQSCFSYLKEIVPQSDKDVLIEMDKRTAVLLLDVSELNNDEDLIQFTRALQETIVTEVGVLMTIGIGERIKRLNECGKSYRQGKKAIEIGKVFQKDNTIFPYHKMILERFLADLPREIAQKYPDMIFNRKTTRLFNEEMLQTIEMFFNKDLNLSDTARQLYIHRNTLVYRLDKVQRIMGLDLRNFQDAVTFKLLLEMRKGANEIFEKEKV